MKVSAAPGVGLHSEHRGTGGTGGTGGDLLKGIFLRLDPHYKQPV